MQCFIYKFRHVIRRAETLALTARFSKSRSYSIMPEDNKLSDFLDYMERLKNYERLGVPEGAGTDSDDGFDLGRMRRLLQRLGNPHTHFRAGLGGATDTTNVLRITELAASIITSIGEEHLAALGGSLESIAMAKSGIIKRGRPLVMGGPFEYHIERIIRAKALFLNSSVVSACDPEISSNIKCIVRESGNPYQICDILIHVQKDLNLSINMHKVKLQMLGNHQLQNAVTATCSAFYLRNQGRRPDIVLLAEVSIAGGKSRTTPALTLKDAWVRTATNLGLDIMDLGTIDEEASLQIPTHNKSIIFSAFQNLPVCNSIEVADHFLKSRERDEPTLIVVTWLSAYSFIGISCCAPLSIG